MLRKGFRNRREKEVKVALWEVVVRILDFRIEISENYDKMCI